MKIMKSITKKCEIIALKKMKEKKKLQLYFAHVIRFNARGNNINIKIINRKKNGKRKARFFTYIRILKPRQLLYETWILREEEEKSYNLKLKNVKNCKQICKKNKNKFTRAKLQKEIIKYTRK